MAQTTIDPRAVVEPGAKLGTGVFVGPFCIVGSDVEIGDGTRLISHVTVTGHTSLGEENEVFAFASLGSAPQDLKYDGEPTKVEIGSRNKIREYVTVNRGTPGGGGLTRVGDDNLLMGLTHIGHDCQIGSRIIFAHAATLAGHVDVGDDATVGAYSGVHQFCRVARHAFIGGYSVVTQDAMPWVLTVGNRAESHGLNIVGLRRKGYSAETIRALKGCYRILFRAKLTLEEAIPQVEKEHGEHEEVRYFLDFVRSSKRGVVR
ncbi:UDP-N-acetylglucosamine acyltransferase [Acidobacteria bacterium Mor1]|nr:UDP-N-acetylglucosamine acyltransferase [Acidobacteria bacterium Mor1]